MSIVQTVLVFVGIPAAIVAFLAICVYGRSEMRQPHRYRPGRPWPHTPVWYLPHPDNLPEAIAPGTHAALTAPHHRPMLPGEADRAAIPGVDAHGIDLHGESAAHTPAAVGGATGEW
jgi:hypothetical protein